MADSSKPAPTPSKPGRPKKGEAPVFNFDNLEFREVEMPKAASNNPFLKALGESYEYDSARAFVVPEEGKNRAEGLIRRAADELEIGASIVSQPATKDGKPLAGMVEIVFKGKPRRKRKGKNDTPEQPAAANEPAADGTPAAGSEPAAEGTPSESATTGAVSEAVAS
jgi:hypothetical protein